MVDFLDNLDAGRRGDGMAAQFAALVVVVPGIELIRAGGGIVALWDLDGCYLEVILRLARGVCAEEQAMGGVGFVCGPTSISVKRLSRVRWRERTILCQGTIGKSDLASRERA